MNHFSTIIPPILNIFYWPLHVSNKSLGRTVCSPSDAKASLAFGDGALPTTQVTLFGGKGGVGKSGAPDVPVTPVGAGPSQRRVEWVEPAGESGVIEGTWEFVENVGVESFGLWCFFGILVGHGAFHFLEVYI